MNLDYGNIIKKSFEITKNCRSLWVFGFIIALFGGSGLNIPNYNFNNSTFNIKDYDGGARFSPSRVDFSEIIMILIVVAVILIVIWLIAMFLSSLANGALIDMVDDIDKKRQVSVKGGFSSGFSLALPLILMSIVIWVPLVLIVILIGGLAIGPGIMLLLAQNEGPGIVLVVLGAVGMLLSILLGAIPAGLINVYGNRYLVLNDNGIVESVKNGYRLLKENIGPSLLLWLINVGIGIGQAIVMLIIMVVVLLVVGIVLGLPIYLLATSINNWLFLLLIIPVGLFIFAIAFTGGLFQSFYSAYWTLAFKDLTKGNDSQVPVTS